MVRADAEGLCAAWQARGGTRVRVHPRSTGSAASVGAVEVVVDTGTRPLYVSIDLRLDSGAIVSRQPEDLGLIHAEADASR